MMKKHVIACFSGEEVAEAFTALAERRQPRYDRR
jgi:hypothetical protein